MKVKSGLDILLEDSFSILKGKSVGLICNQASVDSKLNHIVDLLISNNIKISKIFAPEHGFSGEKQDMDTISDENLKAEKSKIPIISLYGKTAESLIPKKEDLDDLDIILFDLQDIGARYYTFAQTLGYTMNIAAKTKTKVIVIDRPNPINGIDIEGSPIRTGYESFCGYAPIPNRHGMTMAELALIMNKGLSYEDYKIDGAHCELEIVKMENWSRSMFYDETGLPWVFPSPNMPTLETAIVYPGSCLLETTAISEGRGTTKPFELFGASFVDQDKWLEAFMPYNDLFEGAALRKSAFFPKFQKEANKTCYGFQIHITNRNKLRSYASFLALIYSLAISHKEFAWRKDPYEFIDNVPAPDLLYGNSNFRFAIENKSGLESVLNECLIFEKWFKETRKPFLLY